MNTWNGLPSQYWKKVYDSIRAALNKLILQEKGVDNSSDQVDTQGMAYNKDAMKTLLEEPTIKQPVIVAVKIPKANDLSFNAEEGVIAEDGGGDEENAGYGEGEKVLNDDEDEEGGKGRGVEEDTDEDADMGEEDGEDLGKEEGEDGEGSDGEDED